MDSFQTSQTLEKGQLKFYRFVLFLAGSFYLFWWFTVEYVLPGSFNPFASRALAVSCCFLTLLGSFYFKKVADNIGVLCLVSIGVITLHYFYLFHGNKSDMNWIVGSYITVIAAGACFHTVNLLRAYCVFVLALSVVLAVIDRSLLSTVFLPGIITILLFFEKSSTERTKSEKNRILYEATKESLRIRDEFISIAAHELKTPLTSMKIRIETVKMSAETGDSGAYMSKKMEKFVEHSEHQVDRLISLVDNMLDISKISLGKFGLDKKEINFSILIEKIFQSLSDSFERARCQVQLQIEPGLSINVDSAKIEQVVTNLMINAMKYGKGKPVSIHLNQVDQEIRLSIRDHGIGISKVDHERIFEKFERAFPVNHISGLGLGLYISKKIVEDHQGSLRVESELGQGACFTVTLPIRIGDQGRSLI